MNPNQPAQDSSFLGRGWSFPPTFEFDAVARGAAMVEGEEDIQQSLRLIFSIIPGERQMLPEFGCDLSPFVFGPIDTSVLTMIESEVKTALLNYEPRINVETVTLTPELTAAYTAIIIGVTYTVRSTNRRYNLVYPYYVNEGAGVPG